MVITSDHAESLASGHDIDDQHPLDALVPTPIGLPTLCDQEEFDAELESLVPDEAPRLFAVVQVYGERVDGRVAAWGMAFEDHAEVVAADRGLRMTLPAPENALRRFNVGSHIRAHLVWFNPDAATPTDDGETG